MAFKIAIIFTLTVFLNVGLGCESNQVDQLTARQGLDELLKEESYSSANTLWTTPYYYNYQPRTPLSGFANTYEGRTPLNRQQPSYFFKGDEDNLAESRLFFGNLATNLIGSSLFNNRFSPANQFRPFANFFNRIPPSTASSRTAFDSCTSPAGEAGICALSSVCSLFAGRPSGSCSLSRVCCVNVVNGCGKTVTLNNTYWQSPATVSSPSNCALTIKLDAKLAEQSSKPICQIRLDMVSFTTAPPVAGTCTDTFQVGGATTTAPTICGINSGQHMYLNIPSSGVTPSDVQLMFNFAAGAATRSWNIKVAMLPCGADYLAPPDCLQYFTSATGRVSSFNWQDSSNAQQLNNQNYHICFRTELVSSQPATLTCLSVCPVPNGGDAFSITTPIPGAADKAVAEAIKFAATLSAVGTTFYDAVDPAKPVTVAVCLYDFLFISGGRDVNGNIADRYCGNALNPKPLPFASASAPADAKVTAAAFGGSIASIQVCTPVKPFTITYTTDGTEAEIKTLSPPVVPIVAAGDTGNTGFCLEFQQR